MFNLRIALVMMLTLYSTTALGQAGARERELAQIIREAGYDCVLVASITAPPDAPPGFESMRPEIATCIDGKRYLIAKSGRSGGNVRPVVRPMPDAERRM
jgi:hypothetical protein